MSPVINPGPAAETDVVDEVDRLLEATASPPPEYQLRVSSDKVRVILDCPDPLADLTGNVNRILSDFSRLEIPVHPDSEQMAQILQKIATPGAHLVEKTIMMGQKSVPSQDGRLDWSRDFFTTGWAMDETTGAVDFWEKLEDLSVHEGELLVTLLHPVPGESGLNVFGNEIPVTKPAKVKLRCGKGVRTEETDVGVAYFSTVDGRVRYHDGTVAVDDLFTVKGNVNLETGNIRHAGAVLIQGDVEAGATIEAEGDIIIKGMVDRCTITCGGSLSVAGGLLGDEQNRITVDGDLNARYVNEAHVLVKGDVTVTNEISHSVVKARGVISVPKGRVAGGLVQGFRGVRVAQAGASGTSGTKLVAGVDFLVQAQLEELKDKIKQLEEAQEKIAKGINDIKRNQDLDDPGVRQVFEGLTIKSKQLGQAIADQHAQAKKLEAAGKQGAVLEVVIFQEIWTGTQVTLGEFKTVVRATIQKPRIAQLRATRVRILPMGEGNKPVD